MSNVPHGRWVVGLSVSEGGISADAIMRRHPKGDYVQHDDFAALASALRALGVCGEGYCFCATNRDPAKADHTGECVEARRALGEAT